MYGYILAFLSGTCTGLTVAVGKVAAQHLSASMYVFLISFLSLLMMYVWRSMTLTWKINLPEATVRWPVFWQSACSALALWGFWEGARQINTGVASFAVRTELVFVLVASWIFFKEKIEKVGVLGAALILFGSFAMGFRPDESLMLEAGQDPAIYTYGISIVILSGVGFAASECFAKIIANRIEPSALVMWRGLFLGLVFFVMVLVEDGFEAFGRVTAWDWIICAAAALLGPVFARVLFMFSLRRIDLGKAYLICQNEPIVTAVFAWVLIGEKMSPGNITGAVLILIGCVVISLPGLSKPHQSA
jgi:drug/metabolite transporter (DMT)-like permease